MMLPFVIRLTASSKPPLFCFLSTYYACFLAFHRILKLFRENTKQQAQSNIFGQWGTEMII